MSDTSKIQMASVPILAVKKHVAARILGIGSTAFWKLVATDQIKPLPCGTIAISELERFCKETSV